MTDSLGVYSFEGLPEGEYTITPLKEGFIFFPSNVEVSITDSNVSIEYFICWESDENATISEIWGKIIDKDNNPVWGVNVQLFPNPNPQEVGAIKSCKTPRNGILRLSGGPISTNKSYQVVPTKEGYSYTFSPDTSYVIPTESVTVVHFTAIYPGSSLHSISGRAVDVEGNGVFLPVISLTGEDGFEQYYSSTDKDGF